MKQMVHLLANQRYDELIRKRQAETLTDAEYVELLELSNQAELEEAERIRILAEMAKSQQVSLSELMKSMGIEPPKCE
jgi:tRNA(Phe) wybutosine-synthesizing methylase Tyw3